MFTIYTTDFGRFLAYGIDASPEKEALVSQIRDLVRRVSPHGKFPGPNPCSIERRDFDKLRNPYHVCEKTDGVRALLACLTFSGKGVVVLVSRNWEPYLLPITHVPRALYQGSVFDGEVVCDIAGQWTWLGFDAMVVSGVSVAHLPLETRLHAAGRGLKAYKFDSNEDPLEIRFKRYFTTSQINAYREYLSHCPYPVDGTILTPSNDPVVVGRHFGLLKIKTEHTVDFLFQSPDVLLIYDPAAKKHIPVAKLKYTNASSMPQSGTIVECLPTNQKGTMWTTKCVRSDKPTANDMLTFTRTKVNIRERLTVDDILPLLT